MTTNTTSQIDLVINAENMPENLPSFKEIIEKCFALGSFKLVTNGVRFTWSNKYSTGMTKVVEKQQSVVLN